MQITVLLILGFSSLNRKVINIEPRKKSDVYIAVLLVDADNTRNARMQKAIDERISSKQREGRKDGE